MPHPARHDRWPQVVLIGSFVLLCWISMQAVHELGHIVAAWMTGGTVTQVVLHPLTISRTDVNPNPQPALVVWAGPLIGIIIPLLVWGVFKLSRARSEYLARFWAGFCWVANGTYIGLGSFEAIGDAGTMQRSGSPVWSLWLFGLLTVPAGFWMWHGLGPRFGLGKGGGLVDRRDAWWSLLLLLAGAGLMLMLSSVK